MTNAPRRPIAARSLAVSRALAAGVARAGVSANAVSLLGLAFALLAGAALAATRARPDLLAWLFVLAAACVVLRLLCNMLDGMVAVEHGKGTPTGVLYNEVPDRLADVAILVGAGCSPGAAPWLGFAAAIGALLTAYVRALGASVGAGHDFCGPMAKPQRMWVVVLACGACASQRWAGWSAPISIMDAALVVIGVGTIVTCARRLARIAARLRAPRSGA